MITEEPVRGRYAYLEVPGLLSLPPLEQMRAFIRRQLPFPPLHHLSGLVAVEAGPGMSTWTMPAVPAWRSAAGPFLPGTYVFAADAALGTAVFTTLPDPALMATSEISMSFLRPATPDSGNLIARSRLIQAGRGQGLAEATVEDSRGRVLAHGTSRLVISPLPFDPQPAPEKLPAFDPERHDTPDPYLREQLGVVQPQRVWDEADGLTLMRRWQEGELPAPPCGELLGWELTEVEDGAAVGTMPASEWCCTAYRSFYGGAVSLFADSALNAAMTTTLPAGDSYGTLDLKILFLRPVEPDGRPLTARARVAHRGRRLIVATADVEDADGKRVAMATESAMVLPGRPWLPPEPVSTMDEAPGDADA